MEKPFYQLPVGEASEVPVVEINIGPEINELPDGSVVIGEAEVEVYEDKFNENLAEVIDEQALSKISGDLLFEYDNDINSRKDWERTYADGLKLLGLKTEEITKPWEGACGVYSPVITEAVVRFQSETIMETFPAQGPCKTQILGKVTPIKEAAAKRVKEEMNNQLTNVMIEYRPEHEKMLWNLPITGSAFKKVYFDPALQRQTAVFIPAEDVVLPYGVSDIFASPRITHRMRKTKNDLRKLQEAGFYRNVDVGDPLKGADDIQEKKDAETGFTSNNDSRYQLLEFHVDYYIEGWTDKFAKNTRSKIGVPYVITILRDNGEILAIRRNWLEEDETKQQRQHFVHYQYIPGFGSYGFGLIHLIGSAARTATALTRQLVDAGTLANLPGGLKTRGLRIKADDSPIEPGEFRDVDVASGTVRDNIMPLPYKEPSQTLLALLGNIVEEARRFAATADLKISDMSAQAPVGTTLALLERMLKVMSAVQARIHYTLKQELRLIAGIIRDHADPSYGYDAVGDDEDDNARARKDDFGIAEVIPVSDPNAATMSQRIVQYQAVMQLSQGAPHIYNLPQLHRQMLDVIGIKNAETLVPLPEEHKPIDPVAENMNALMSKPMKAFAYQDHDAHMAVHQSFMQDPKVAAAIGQNPAAQQITAALMAHIAEHAAYAYRLQIEQQLGVPLPEYDEAENSAPIDPSVEKQFAPLIAQAAQRTMMMNQAMAAQQQNQAAAQNPELQLQQMELALKEKEMQRKDRNDKYDYEVALMRADIERQRLKLDGAKAQAQILNAKDKADRDRQAKAASETMKTLAKLSQPPRGSR